MLSQQNTILPYIILTLQTKPKNRTTRAIYLIVTQLYNYKPLLDLINAKSNEIEREVLIELSTILSHKSFKSNEVIQRINDDNEVFYIILKGRVAELSLKYHKYFLTKEEYIIHLLMLHLSNETEVLYQCINMNKEMFPIKEGIIKWIQTNNEIQADEFIIKSKKALRELEAMNKGKDVNYYVSLTSQYLNRTKSKFESKTQYHITLPSYSYTRTLKEGNYIGTLSLNKRNKITSTFIPIEDCDMGLIEKSPIDITKDHNDLFASIEFLIKEDLGIILSNYFIFNHLSRDYTVNTLSPMFTYKSVSKGEFIYKQNTNYEGVYLIKKGEFKVTVNKKYDELNGLIVDLKQSLNCYPDYINDLKSKLNEDYSNENIELSPFAFTPEFATQRKMIKEIKISTINKKQILGLSEYYNNHHILNFNVECISKSADVYFLPKESFFSIISKDNAIRFNAAQLTEKNANFFIEEIRKYKRRYVLNIESFAKASTLFGFNGSNNSNNHIESMSSLCSSSSHCKIISMRAKSYKINKLTSNNSISSIESISSSKDIKSISQKKILNKKFKVNRSQMFFARALAKKLDNKDNQYNNNNNKDNNNHKALISTTVFPTLFRDKTANTISPYKIYLLKKDN